MKTVKKNKHILYVLRDAKSKLRKNIFENCDDCVIQAIAEIIHNCLIGNIPLKKESFKQLEKFKKQLERLHRFIVENKCTKKRRKYFANQRGGFLPLLIEAALSSALSYGGEKLLEYGWNKFTGKKEKDGGHETKE